METFAQEVAAEAQAARDAAANTGRDDGSHGADGAASTTAADVGAAQSGTGVDNGTPPGTGQAQSTEQQQTVPRRALEDEREKRQLERQLREGLERRIAELEASVNSARAVKVDEKPAVDYDKLFEDPAAVFDAHAKAVESRLSGDRLHMSREMARAQLPDYDETIGKIADLNVPGLEEAVAKSPAPAFTAYRMIKDYERSRLAQAQGSEQVKNLEAKLAEATAQLEAFRNGNVPNLPSLSQSRGSTAGTQHPVKTADSVTDAVWGKTLRKR